MASNVVVIDTSARRATVKVTPSMPMSDVLTQACSKLGLRSELYGLKYNKKQLDLSLTHRLSGLPPGAQLELVQSSRSPTVVNVALQFPQSENNLRLTEKFSSTTSLWQILRRFESGTSGGAPYPLNITERSIAQTASGSSSGAGRMFYETPVLSLMNRTFESFVDLQKTLAQIGVTSGSALLRLSFKNSEMPLEEAMAEITRYFKETEAGSETKTAHGAHAAAPGSSHSQAEPTTEPPAIAGSDNPPSPPDSEPMEDVTPTPAPTTTQNNDTPQTTSPTTIPTIAALSRIQVYAAPSGPTTSIPHNENDYIPTIDHAKIHQSRLEAAGRNTRLLSDAELDQQRRDRESKLSTVQTVRVRFRFPDQMMVEAPFARHDTAQSLFATIADVLRYPEEPYLLSFRDAKGQTVGIGAASTEELIGGLGWTGATLVSVSWADGASAKARAEPSLNDEHAAQAKKLQVEQPKDDEEDERDKKSSFLGNLLGKKEGKEKSKLSGAEKEAKLSKMLFGGKKK